MKVLSAFLVFAIGSAAALGSGPYLPSGWKPEGPAFYLPSEVQKPALLKDAPLQETEASGSDFLREYGPPKILVSDEVIAQGLPDAVTEQSFVALEAKFGQDEGAAVDAATEVTELKSEGEEIPSATEAQVEEQTRAREIQGKSLDIQVDSAVVEKSEGSVAAVENEGAADAVQTEELKTVEEGIRNIAEAIVNLEKEVEPQQVQVSQDFAELKTLQQSSEPTEQVPEGFLEYGPPGFREYGPPVQAALLRNPEEINTEAEKIDNNETRRRRFSPKFRSAKTTKH